MRVRGVLSRACTLVSRVFGWFLRYIESCAHEGPRLVYVMSRITLQSYPGYPYLGYPKPRLSECGVCLKSMVFSLKWQTLYQSRVHDCVCVSYVHVQCRYTVVRHRVQCDV